MTFRSRITFCLFMSSVWLAAQVQYKGFNPQNLDRSVSPTRDFYQFAVGGWIDHTAMPADRSKYGVDQEVDDRTDRILRDLLEGAARDAGAPAGSDRRKLGDFFASAMDLAAVEAAGIKPLAADLAGIQGVADRAGLARELAALHRRGPCPGFAFDVEQDDRDSCRMVAVLDQGGLGLPERDYYLLPAADCCKVRDGYRAHLARMFRLLGEAPEAADRDAGAVLEMETGLARAALGRAERRNPEATYHRMTRAELAAAAPGFDWEAYFGALGLPASEPVLVRQPAFLKAMGDLAASRPLADWQAYLRWTLLRTTAPYLSADFESAHFDFYGRTLRGVRAQRDRWHRAMGWIDDAMGEALGRLYVERTFPPAAKAQVLEMVGNLRAALRARIQGLAWMSPGAKAEALAKLDAMRVKIGYPDAWRDYSALRVDRASLAGNVLAAWGFEFDRRLAKVGQPLDRGEWDMTPCTNNACYNPTMNEICFPAAILQPPYFDPAADPAVNYGDIGATIGHEMTHAFDDGGRKYDCRGNLRDWWSAGDRAGFEAQAARMVHQFEGFKPFPDLGVDGRATLGENIADLGGLEIAFAAFRRSQEGRPAQPSIDGFTPEQRFFLGYAESWRCKYREEALRERLRCDSHAPAKYRVNGPLADMPEFFQAFGAREGDPMRTPEDRRPVIW